MRMPVRPPESPVLPPPRGNAHAPAPRRPVLVLGVALLTLLSSAWAAAPAWPTTRATLPTGRSPVSYKPPASIAHNCSADVSGPLMAWLHRLPAGTPGAPVVVRFAPRGCYLLNESLYLRGFTDITFDGDGATFRQDHPTIEMLPAAGPSHPYCGSPVTFGTSRASQTSRVAAIMWQFEGGCDITLKDMDIKGPNAGGGRTSGGGSAVDSAIQLDGVQRALVEDNVIRDVDGDFVTISGLHESRGGGGTYPSTDVTVIGNRMLRSGRQGITSEYVTRVRIADNYLTGWGATAFDEESDVVGGCTCDLSIEGNTIDGSGPFLLAALTGSSVQRLAFTGNRLVNGGQMKMQFAVGLPSSDITIDHNVADSGAGWPFASILLDQSKRDAVLSSVIRVQVADNTVPAGSGDQTFVMAGLHAYYVQVRNNALPTSRGGSGGVLVNENLSTTNGACGNHREPSSLLDGPCPKVTFAPYQPEAPVLPAGVVLDRQSSPGAGRRR